MELTHRSIPNIAKMADFGYEANAKGMLTTCWGDYGEGDTGSSISFQFLIMNEIIEMQRL